VTPETLNIGIRFGLYATLMLLFGLPMFALSGWARAERPLGDVLPLRIWTICLALAGLVLSLLGIVAMTTSMAGVPLFQADAGTIAMMITQTPMGSAWQARMVALLLVLLIAAAIGRRKTATWLGAASLGAGLALASLAWTGHGAAGEGAVGTVELLADILHLLAAGIWLGALVALGALLIGGPARRGDDHHRLTQHALDRFSTVGTIVVVLVTGSGLVNAFILVGPSRILALDDTAYGQVLIAKLALFGAMLVLAALNRFRLTPALGRTLGTDAAEPAIAHLRWSLALESGAAIAILGLVAWLGTLEPPT
jgi:putative copper resistance protein D